MTIPRRRTFLDRQSRRGRQPLLAWSATRRVLRRSGIDFTVPVAFWSAEMGDTRLGSCERKRQRRGKYRKDCLALNLIRTSDDSGLSPIGRWSFTRVATRLSKLGELVRGHGGWKISGSNGWLGVLSWSDRCCIFGTRVSLP